MTRIVTTTYRYKPPPKRKGKLAEIIGLAEITGPAVVTTKKGRRPAWVGEAAAEVEEYVNAHPERADRVQPSTAPAPERDPAGLLPEKRHLQPTTTDRASRRSSPCATGSWRGGVGTDNPQRAAARGRR